MNIPSHIEQTESGRDNDNDGEQDRRQTMRATTKLATHLATTLATNMTMTMMTTIQTQEQTQIKFMSQLRRQGVAASPTSRLVLHGSRSSGVGPLRETLTMTEIPDAAVLQGEEFRAEIKGHGLMKPTWWGVAPSRETTQHRSHEAATVGWWTLGRDSNEYKET